MVKLSYLEITARPDYPHVGVPTMHLWEPTLKTLAKQTFKDFECIFIDVFYDERPNYFRKNHYGLKIKHIPAAPNIWHGLGLVQTCEQFNKGIIYSDGELIFTSADSNMYPPDLMENLWRRYQEGYFVSLGFGADLTYAQTLYKRQLQADGSYAMKQGNWQQQSISSAEHKIIPTDWYKFLGYNGKVIMDHRYNKLFQNPNMQIHSIPPEWYYGISTMSLEAALAVNGYEVKFDGDSALNDVDCGERLVRWQGRNNLVMSRECYCVEAYAGTSWHPKMMSPRPEIKCNYALLLWNKAMENYRANEPLSDVDIEYIQKEICGRCGIRETCKTHYPHRAPFYNKNQPELYAHWKKYAAPYHVDLEVEREERIRGEYDGEGTFVNI